ncbi:VOC family protein [Streptomyces sp. So13.3]|uniref:VOC family protein n=1 Tax=Streptomyces TaxID=1883 RepID=UPI0011066E88|nr:MULTISPECIES: VOC family protein [Streptomyces]MCZ4101350.1 VOC family protein [Streptomyces sp. H39-C1]QNA76814.1 VOC family protein [Streptomyces sp. So13.3]
MSYVTSNPPDGTPTWIDLVVPDRERAMEFYRALFGWEYAVGSAESGHCTMCLLRGKPVAALVQDPEREPAGASPRWTMYIATDDCDATAKRVTEAGGTLITAPGDVMDQGRMALAEDPVGSRFGLWQGRAHVGCEIVNEPGSLVRNDLVTPDPGPARAFYTAVFGYTLDSNKDLPDVDFTFLRRPDGYEIGGIFGLPDAPSSAWATTFEVDGTDAAVERATAAGGTAGVPEDMTYGRIATVTDPFGTEFSVITRA